MFSKELWGHRTLWQPIKISLNIRNVFQEDFQTLFKYKQFDFISIFMKEIYRLKRQFGANVWLETIFSYKIISSIFIFRRRRVICLFSDLKCQNFLLNEGTIL